MLPRRVCLTWVFLGFLLLRHCTIACAEHGPTAASNTDPATVEDTGLYVPCPSCFVQPLSELMDQEQLNISPWVRAVWSEVMEIAGNAGTVNGTCTRWDHLQLDRKAAETMRDDATIVTISAHLWDCDDINRTGELWLRASRIENGDVQTKHTCNTTTLSENDLLERCERREIEPTISVPQADQETNGATSSVPGVGPALGSWSGWRFKCQSGSEFTAARATFTSSLGSDTDYGPMTLSGEVSVEVDLSLISVNQCDTLLPSWGHGCPQHTKCLAWSDESGVRLGAYDCLCETGLCAANASQPRSRGRQRGYSGRGSDQQQLQQQQQWLRQGSNSTVCGDRGWVLGDYDTQCVPCPEYCDGTRDLFEGQCLSQPAMLFRVLVAVFAAVTILGILVTMLLLYRYRNEKIIRAASPSLLCSTLVGCLMLDGELLVVVFQADDVTCMVRPWFHHIGFCIAYGALVLKTWRVAVILNTFKARMLQTHDSQLHKKVLAMVCACATYMTIWTAVDPVKVNVPEADIGQCSLQWWEIVMLVGELTLVSWGGHMCHKARKAPDLYNEARPVSYAMWNEGLWVFFYLLAIVMLDRNPDPDMWVAIHFIRVQLTVPVTILLLFVPKFYFIFRSVRELHGTLTDVYGPRRVHRFSLLVSKKGEVKTIHCVPCGPLAYMEKDEDDDTSDTSSHDSRNAKETEYTKAEVDTLISMVASLKRERELYKTQVRRLLRLLTEYKRKAPNGVLPSLLAELPEAADTMQEVHRHQGCCERSLANCDSGIASGGEGHLTNPVVVPRTGLYSRKASTVSTFLSSSPDTTSVANDSSSGAAKDAFQTPVDLHYSGSNCIQLSMWNELMPVCSNAAAAAVATSQINGVGPSAAKHTKARQSEHHREAKIASDATEDFPKLIQTHNSNCDNKNKLLVENPASPFIPAVCSSVPSAARIEDTHELRDIGAPNTPDRHAAKLGAENANFVMYI